MYKCAHFTRRCIIYVLKYVFKVKEYVADIPLQESEVLKIMSYGFS